jgi:hypothetical protein
VAPRHADDAEQEWINHDPGAELQTLAQARQERDALQLRMGGASYIEIGEHLGCSAREANRIVAQAIKAEVPTELRDEVRAITLARLDILIKRAMIRLGSSAATPDEQDRAEDMILKITDRIVDITGAREPIKIDARVTDALDEEIAILVADLTRPIPAAPNVTPPGRSDDDRINPDLSQSSGRWQGRMRRGGPDDQDRRDRGYDDPGVP